MNGSPSESATASPLIAALGDQVLPADELSDFFESLSARWPGVMRYRREVMPDSLPAAGDAVTWYRLACHVDAACAERPSRHLCYATADYYLQDAGSLLALAAAGADRDFRTGGSATLLGEEKDLAGRLVCDLCASPGGKSTALVEAIGDDGFVLANEPIRSRVPPLNYNLARTGSDRYAISCLDPDRLADTLGAVFDVVLVDAPCSGQALLSRGRQSASALSPKQVAHSAARQNRILDAAVRLLRPGGRLIYSTCTFAEAENEAQLRRLIAADEVRPRVVEELQRYRSADEACYRLWPHRDRCAGSFAASMEALREYPVAKMRRAKSKRDGRPVRAESFAGLSDWLSDLDGSSRLWLNDSVLVGWPSDSPAWLEQIAIAGPELAHRAGQTWKPSHAAALRRVKRGGARQNSEVDAAIAKQFLTGQTIPSSRRGWQAVTWKSRPLGWIKSNGTTGKNHLPTAARMTGEIAGA